MMKNSYLRFCRGHYRRWTSFFLIFITIFNFGFGLVLFSSFILNVEKSNILKESKILTESIVDEKSKEIEEAIEKEYEYYFRIDYTIVQGLCRPINMFHTRKNLISIENLTNSKLKSLLKRNLSIIIDIISFNPILKKSANIKEISLYDDIKSRCDYVLKLNIGLSFSSYCDEKCRLEEIEHLTCRRRPFGDPIKDEFILKFYPIDPSELIILFNIHQMLFLESSKYFDKSVYIRSYNSNEYFLSLILDSDAYRLSITMSENDRSLFLIKDGLYKTIPENDCSSIYVSFLSKSVSNSYIRHESGKLKLKKLIKTNLFKKDATFNLIFSKTNKNIVAFKAINLPRSYISIDPLTPKALILDDVKDSQTNIDSFQKRFLFQFTYDQ